MKAAQSLKSAYVLWAVVLLQAVSSGAQPVTRIAAEDAASLFLKSDGSLWAMGGNGGQFGDGTYNHTNRPELIIASNVTTIAAENGDSLFLKNDGSLWAMGANQWGELGDGTYDPTNRPVLVVASNVTAIAGFQHSLFLKSDGSLWGMGYNGVGQLGDGTYNNTNQPEMIVASNVVAIAAGSGHSLFLKSDGSLWAMGLNVHGQLGDGTQNINTNRPEMIVDSNVTAIAAGDDHSLFLKSDGSLWAMGDDDVGQLGDGAPANDGTNQPEMIVASNVTAIAAGGEQSLFLKSDGSLWAMGWNYSGELGDGTYNDTNRPEMIVTNNVTAISAAVNASQSHTLFLKSDGSLWAMGDNSTGELGDGTYNSTNRPEQIVAGPPGYGYNQMSIQLLSIGDVCSYFGGVAGTNYALERSFNLMPPDWVPQVTNPANIFGVAVFTNTPDPTTNNFWRIRSVP